MRHAEFYGVATFYGVIYNAQEQPHRRNSGELQNRFLG